MNIVLYDHPAARQQLLPFTFTRPLGDLRVGILTIAQKWQQHLGGSVSFLTQPYLQAKFAAQFTADNLIIHGSLCPDKKLLERIRGLQTGEGLYNQQVVLAYRTSEDELPEVLGKGMTEYTEPLTLIDQPWKIFQHNAEQLRADFDLITRGRTSHPITDPHTRVYSPDNIFLEKGVEIRAAVLNAEPGPIYLGVNSQVQEGALIKGPFSLGEESVVNMGGKMRGDTTIGPRCKVGGEISNSVLWGNSNKAHDGFLGNSVLGEWCNLGADTNTSNLKNNYEPVKLWSYGQAKFVSTGLQFCGLMMGDHSKCGINTMFNTGTVVGVGANIFGDGYPRNFVPSFAWGGAAGFTTFALARAFETAARVMERRKQVLTEADKAILASVFEQTAGYRIWEKKS
jgi:UDP-N-acetylglucosamine diphosphorylase/glucosamine-1-phosphate N-acetyltransferase